MRRDWTELNVELLHLISKKLENFSNIVRFRSICKQWRLIVDPTDCPPRLPWILTPSLMQISDTKTEFTVYSLSSNTTMQITLPIHNQEYRDVISRESTFSYLVLSHYSFKTLRLFNPISQNTFHLPFPAPHFMIYMGPDPSSDSSRVKGGVHVVMCQFVKNGASQIGFWKSQKNEFTSFRIPVASFTMGYYKGKLFVYSARTRKTRVFEMTSGDELNIVIENAVEHLDYVFLVEAMGELLWVALSCDTMKFDVHRLEHTDDFEVCRWVKLKGIGDRMLFLTAGNRVSAFCLSSSDFNGLRGNCIYRLFDNCVERYNMEDGTTDELLKFPSSFVKWFMPCLS